MPERNLTNPNQPDKAPKPRIATTKPSRDKFRAAPRQQGGAPSRIPRGLPVYSLTHKATDTTYPGETHSQSNSENASSRLKLSMLSRHPR